MFKSVSTLSGGEKGRLALARLIYTNVNVLILDEPTNHLDIASCEALEEALNEYNGTIITVSHDRYFLDRIATRILYFGDGRVENFDGTYSEFYESHHRSGATKPVEPEKPAQEVKKQAYQAAAADGGQRRRPKGPTPAEIESLIQSAETELQQLSAKLSTDDISRNHQQLIEVSRQYEETESKIRELYSRWEEAVEEARS
ncbi:MAG: ABC transporter ATP-binding protein [Acidobacteria bacterium]|nr:ABC transporter ATP-binding protein [Acidobacteriota bacterium]